MIEGRKIRTQQSVLTESQEDTQMELKRVQEYERAVIFRLGRLLTSGARGWVDMTPHYKYYFKIPHYCDLCFLINNFHKRAGRVLHHPLHRYVRED